MPTAGGVGSLPALFWFWPGILAILARDGAGVQRWAPVSLRLGDWNGNSRNP